MNAVAVGIRRYDFAAHVDYVHINPPKHELVEKVADWPYSTFHRWVEEGAYTHDWGANVGGLPKYDDEALGAHPSAQRPSVMANGNPLVGLRPAIWFVDGDRSC